VWYYLYIIKIVWCKCKCRQNMKTITHVCMTASFHEKGRIWSIFRPRLYLLRYWAVLYLHDRISIWLFLRFAIGFWNWSDSVVYFLFYIIFKKRLCQVEQDLNKCFTDLFCEYTKVVEYWCSEYLHWNGSLALSSSIPN
jgi:hypothetical protein